MKIAIIGAGKVGSALAGRWLAAGHTVLLGVRDPGDAKTKDKLSRLRGATAAIIAQAAADADAIILSTPWNAARDAISAMGDLRGRLLVDCINPVKPDLSGIDAGPAGSATAQIMQWAPGAAVFKCFNITGADNMATASDYSTKPVMFYCGDDPTKRATVKKLVEDTGFEPIDAGDSKVAPLLEAMAMLWINLAMRQKMGRDFAYGLLHK
jgi:predicted dinucleotide-binding enzyme